MALSWVSFQLVFFLSNPFPTSLWRKVRSGANNKNGLVVGSSGEWGKLLGATAKSLGVSPAALPEPNLQIPEIYLDFAAKTLDFAIFPQQGRHHFPVAPETDDKAKARQRIHEHVTDGVRNSARFREDLVDANGIIFAQFFRRVGDCRLPMCVGPKQWNIPENQWIMPAEHGYPECQKTSGA